MKFYNEYSINIYAYIYICIINEYLANLYICKYYA